MDLNTATTIIARNKFAKAHMGDAPLPKLSKMAFGDGGHNVGGDPIPPNGDELEVPGEFVQVPINQMTLSGSTAIRIEGTLSYGEGNGKLVSSVGIYDEVGDLVAVKTFSPKAKDEDTKLDIVWYEKF